MKKLSHTFWGALFLLPGMMMAQEQVEEKKEKGIVIEWSKDAEFPELEGVDEETRLMINEELKKINIEYLNDKDAQMTIFGGITIEDEIEDGDQTHQKTVKIIRSDDGQGDIIMKKFINGEEFPVDADEKVLFLEMDGGDFPEGELDIEIERLVQMAKEGGELNSEELEECLKGLHLELDGVETKNEEVKIIQKLGENGEIEVKTFVNGEEVENAEFPEMDFSWLEGFQSLNPKKVVVIREEIFIDTITEEDNAPVNLRTSKEELELEEFSMFPNPNDGRFNLTLQSASNAKINVRILNAEGKTIYNQKLKPSGGLCTQEIDISGEAKGLYFLNVEQKGKFLSRKIVLQ